MKYIALKTKSSVNGAFVGLAEVVLLTVGGVNLLANANVVASSDYGGDLSISNLTDGQNGTGWTNSGDGANQRVVFTLPKEFYGDIAKIIIRPQIDSAVAPTAFDIEISNTGNIGVDSEWSVIHSFSNLVWESSVSKEFLIPYTFVVPASIENDKLRMSQIVFKLKLGEFISDDDSVFYALGGDSALATSAMVALDQGKGYDGLRELGITDSTSLKVLSVYNVKLDALKYESEKALERLENDPMMIVSFRDYLLTLNIAMPSLSAYIARLRADANIYTAAREWVKTLPLA